MSEYQYYEFLALDRPLTEKQITELGAISTRAEIASTRFCNHYKWGDLKADPAKRVARYFDAFLYLANWGRAGSPSVFRRTRSISKPSSCTATDTP